MLEIRLFGAPEVRLLERGGQLAALHPAEVELLAFVALHCGRPVRRDAITAALWHDGTDHDCRRRLNTALWRLRRGIEQDLPRGTYVQTDRSSILIDLTAVELDVAAFEHAARAAEQPTLDQYGADSLQRAVDGYRGDLLEGSYEDWVVQARERLLSRYLGALGRLLVWHHDQGDPAAAVATGMRMLERDPLREDVHRILIRSFGVLGARSRAVEQYHTCRSLLREELGMEPLPETTAAVAAVVGRSVERPALADRTPSHRGVPAALVLHQLQDLRDRVNGLADAIDEAIAQLQR